MKSLMSFLLISAAFLLAVPVARADATVVYPIGSPASVTVTVASGTAPFTYQWFKDGAPIAGATSSVLKFAALAATDAGVYTCKVTNSVGNTTSDKGNLNISVGPNGATLSFSNT